MNRLNTPEIRVPLVAAEATVTQKVTSLTNAIPEMGLASAYLRGRTVANILQSVGDCESTSGWALFQCTLATDAIKVFGTYGIKMTLTGTDCSIEQNFFSSIDVSRNYLLAGYIKNGNTTSLQLRLSKASAVTISSDIVSSTSWTRVGIIVNSAYLADATQFKLGAYVTGTNTQYAYIDGIQLIEITSAEYALGATALLSKYPYHNDIKGSDKQIVKSVGKNLFNKETVRFGGYYNATNAFTADVLYFSTDFIRVSPSTQYKHNSSSNNVINYYGIDQSFISSENAQTFTTPSSASYIKTSCAYTELSTYQIELGSTATTYEPHKPTSAIVPVALNSVSDTIYDKFDTLTGLHTKNVSDVVTLSGNAYTWVFQGDDTGFKKIRISNLLQNISQSDYWQGTRTFKYNNKELVKVESGVFTAADYTYVSIPANGHYDITVADTDTGWDEAWVSGTSFTGMTWGGLIKAYMNGWKMTTANVNVASAVWTGITSGTVKNAGAADYTHVTTTIDTGFQPYRMYYQLATPVSTKYPSNVMTAYPSGTILVESAVEDKGTYTTLFTPTDVATRPIGNLVSVNKITPSTGLITPIALSTCTVAALGASFTSTALTSGDYIEVVYNTIGISSIPSLTYSTYNNLAGGEQGLAKQTQNLDIKLEEALNQIKYLLGVTNTMLQEQADVAVTINAIVGSETNVLSLATALTNYELRDLRIKSVDPGADTITVRLYQLINDVLTVTDTFAITTANYTTYYSLMDLFGIPHVAGGNIKVTVQTSANTYAITGQYAHAKSL